MSDAIPIAALVAGLAIVILLWIRCLRVCKNACGADWGNIWLNRLDGLNRIFCRWFHRLDAGGASLPATGAALLVANHVSGLDPMVMLASVQRPLRFMIAREQYDRIWLKWLFRMIGCIPVERERRPERALRAAMQALDEGEVVALYPHGKIHLDSDPPVHLKGGVIRLSRYADCAIYPLRITGVRAAGWVVSSVFVRSHVRVRAFPPLSCPEGVPSRNCLRKLQCLLDGKADAQDCNEPHAEAEK